MAYKNTEWNNLRSRLHHDWMQKYITFLYARCDALDEMSAGKLDWREDIKEQLLEWNEKKVLFLKLIDSCEEALSPRQLLCEPPLDSMDEENKKWLGEIINRLYLERTHILEATSTLKSIFAEANNSFEYLLHSRSGEPSSAKYFLDRLTEFSKMISKLPHGIQVI